MKNLFFILYLGLAYSSYGQLFFDDFESYAVGSYVGPQSSNWTTWSGNEGGAEDVQVTNNQASSGTNSIYFSSTSANGGPQDVVLEFGQLYNSGVFTFQSDFFINPNKTGYFNFQGSQTIGQSWALNVNFDAGQMYIDDGITSALAIAAYPEANWFTLRIEANLTLKVWKAFLNDALVGTWINGVNNVASIDLYPIQNSQFYVDNVSFDHQPYTLSNLNAMVAMVDMDGLIAGETTNPVVTVVNAGSTPISSFDLSLNYNGSNYPMTVSGVNILSTANYAVSISPLVLQAGNLPVETYVSNVNGMVDDVSSDDTLNSSIDPVVPAVGKMVVSEEGTGTWCQWCPRGTVFMDQFHEKYSDFWIGIAVHNGDPMAVSAYDTPFGGLISGYPSSVVDRGVDVDPSNMTPDFLERIQIAPKAFITNGALWDPLTRDLSVSVTADLQNDIDNTYKLVCVIAEDSVTGSSSAYNQSNAYAGGGNGVMGGFESLPNPVPASQMVYNHVARAIAPGFDGQNNSFPAVALSGEAHSVNFMFNLPLDWDENNLHIVGMMIDGNGRIDNAFSSTIEEAVLNGYVNGNNASISTQYLNNFSLTAFPNPVNQELNLVVKNAKNESLHIKIIDEIGRVVENFYLNTNGAPNIRISTSSMRSGHYILQAISGEQVVHIPLIKE